MNFSVVWTYSILSYICPKSLYLYQYRQRTLHNISHICEQRLFNLLCTYMSRRLCNLSCVCVCVCVDRGFSILYALMIVSDNNDSNNNLIYLNQSGSPTHSHIHTLPQFLSCLSQLPKYKQPEPPWYSRTKCTLEAVRFLATV